MAISIVLTIFAKFVLTAALSQGDIKSCLQYFGGLRGSAPRPLPRDCRQARELGGGVDGMYAIFPLSVGNCEPILVYCDQNADGGGWTLIQRRMDGRMDFLLGWEDYRNGFGQVHGEHWLGLENIHRIVMQGEYELFVRMINPIMEEGKAQYYRFSIGSEATNYTLSIAEFDPSSNAGDALSGHNNQPFSTIDRDNDNWTGNCALEYTGAWWYTSCHTSNLNGQYSRAGPYEFAKGVVWQPFTGYRSSAIYSEMKVRPRI